MLAPVFANGNTQLMLSLLRYLSLVPLLLALPALAIGAETRQDITQIQHEAQQYLAQVLAVHQGRATAKVGKLDNRLNLPACEAIEFTALSGRMLGNVMLKAHCTKGATWSLNVPASITIRSSYLVAARPIIAGQEMTDADLDARDGELSTLPPTIAVLREQVLGKVASSNLSAGTPIRLDMFRSQPVVQANQVVRVVAKGSGFEVTTEGRALGTAMEGQTVTVRMISGSVVQGIARPGPTVEVNY